MCTSQLPNLFQRSECGKLRPNVDTERVEVEIVGVKTVLNIQNILIMVYIAFIQCAPVDEKVSQVTGVNSPAT